MSAERLVTALLRLPSAHLDGRAAEEIAVRLTPGERIVVVTPAAGSALVPLLRNIVDGHKRGICYVVVCGSLPVEVRAAARQAAPFVQLRRQFGFYTLGDDDRLDHVHVSPQSAELRHAAAHLPAPPSEPRARRDPEQPALRRHFAKNARISFARPGCGSGISFIS
jgi:hypothetical protein